MRKTIKTILDKIGKWIGDEETRIGKLEAALEYDDPDVVFFDGARSELGEINRFIGKLREEYLPPEPTCPKCEQPMYQFVMIHQLSLKPVKMKSEEFWKCTNCSVMIRYATHRVGGVLWWLTGANAEKGTKVMLHEEYKHFLYNRAFQHHIPLDTWFAPKKKNGRGVLDYVT